MTLEVWILHVNRKRSRTPAQNAIFFSFLSPSSSLAPRDRLALAPLGIRLYTRVFLALFLLNARPIHPRSTPWRLELVLMKKTYLQALVESFKLTEEINALSLSLCRTREMCTRYKSCNPERSTLRQFSQFDRTHVVTSEIDLISFSFCRWYVWLTNAQ